MIVTRYCSADNAIMKTSEQHQEHITRHTCTRDKVIGFVHLSACHHKIARSGHLGIWALVNTTNPYKSSKICLNYASNGLARPTSITNTASLMATPIDSTHPLQAMCIRQLHTHTCCCSSHFHANRCGCRCNVWRGMCSIELRLFRSALGMGEIMRDPAHHVVHGRKTLQMHGFLFKHIQTYTG